MLCGTYPAPSAQSSLWGLPAIAMLYEGDTLGPFGNEGPCYSGQRKERGEARSSACFLGYFNREQRDPIYLKDKVTQRHSKEQFETAQKIEQEYSRYFTGRCVSGLERSSRRRGWKHVFQ